MKNLLSLGLLVALLAFPIQSLGKYVSVMADEVTGAVVPSNLEARLVAVDMGTLAEDVATLQEDYSIVAGSLSSISGQLEGFLTSESDPVAMNAGFITVESDPVAMGAGFITIASLEGLSNSVININSSLGTLQTNLMTASNYFSIYLGTLGTNLNLASNFYSLAIGTLQTNLNIETGNLAGVSNNFMTYSNDSKKAESKPLKKYPVNGSVTLALTNRYYYIWVSSSTLTNWIVEMPQTAGAVWLVDLYFNTNSTFAWGGSLAGCTNLPTPPPSGYSSYIFEVIMDSTNIIAIK